MNPDSQLIRIMFSGRKFVRRIDCSASQNLLPVFLVINNGDAERRPGRASGELLSGLTSVWLAYFPTIESMS